MSKCGKGCMPECEYFTTGGCISPFNCIYKIHHESITTATSVPLNPNVIYTNETYKDTEIARLTAENAELKARLERAMALPFIHKLHIKGMKDNTITLYQIVYIDDDNSVAIDIENCEERAKKRIAILKGSRE